MTGCRMYWRTASVLVVGLIATACEIRQSPESGSPASAAVPLVVRVEGACRDMPLTHHCWKKLEDPVDCWFWTSDSDMRALRVKWTGNCSEGIAEGTGALSIHSRFATRSEDANKGSLPRDDAHEGSLLNGRRNGDWVENLPRGWVREVKYVNGKRNGKSTIRNREGIILWERHYRNDKLNGEVVQRSPDGTVLMKGSYVDEKAHGEYVRYSSLDGSLVASGAYVDGERDGQWIQTSAGLTLEGRYLRGKREGEWVVRRKDGLVVAEGSFVDDMPLGNWIYRSSDGSVSKGAYEHGKRIGTWNVSDPHEPVDVPFVVRVEGQCVDTPLGSPCWKELEQPQGCYVWSSGADSGSFLSIARVTWTGECSNDIAQGKGVLMLEYPTPAYSETARRIVESGHVRVRGSERLRPAPVWPTSVRSELGSWSTNTIKRAHKGTLENGRKTGEWVDAQGKRNDFVEHFVNGMRTKTIQQDWRGIIFYESNHLDGELNGDFVTRKRKGVLIVKGSYVAGERDGYWIEPSTFSSEFTLEGTYRSGARNGRWRVRDRKGDVASEGSFVDGEPHGDWMYRSGDGFLTEGTFINAERVGAWKVRDPDGNITTLRYENEQPNEAEHKDQAPQRGFLLPVKITKRTSTPSASCRTASPMASVLGKV